MGEYTESIRITGDSSSAEAAFDRVSRKVSSSAASWASGIVSVGRHLDTLGKGMVRTGRSLTTYVTLPLVGVGVAAFKMARDFGQAMANVNSLLHVSQDELAVMSDQLRALSLELPQTATQLAEGLYEIVSSGFDGAEAMTILEAGARAASAGLTTTNVAVAGIVAALNAYGLAAEDAVGVSDTLFRGVDKGIMTFEELSSSIGTYVASAAALKIPLEDVVAAQAAITLTGEDAATAATLLNATLRGILDPSKAMVAVLNDFGYETGLAALKAEGLQGIMQILSGSVGENTDAWLKLFPDIRATRGALALTADEGAGLNRVMDAMADKAGTTGRALEEQAKGPAFRFGVALNKLRDAMIDLGNQLIPILLDDILPAVQKAVDWFQQLPDSTKEWGVELAIAAAAFGPLLMVLGSAVRLLGLIIRLGGGAIGALTRIGGAAGAAGAAAGAGGAVGGAGRAFSGALATGAGVRAASGIALSPAAAGAAGAAAGASWGKAFGAAAIARMGTMAYFLGTIPAAPVSSFPVEDVEAMVSQFKTELAEVNTLFGTSPIEAQAWQTSFDDLESRWRTTIFDMLSSGDPDVRSAARQFALALDSEINGALVGAQSAGGRDPATRINWDAIFNSDRLDAAVSSLRGSFERIRDADWEGLFGAKGAEKEAGKLLDLFTSMGGKIGPALAEALKTGDFETAIAILTRRIRGYLRELEKVPDEKNTKVDAPGIGPATDDFLSLRDAVNKTPDDKKVPVATPGSDPAIDDFISLRDSIVKTPNSKVTTVTTPGADGAVSILRTINGQVYDVTKTITILTQYQSQGQPASGGDSEFASGGIILTGLAQGGILTAARGLIARGPSVLVGEGRYATAFGGGAEAVLPLTDSVLGRLGTEIARATAGGRGDSKGGGPQLLTIPISLDGRVIAEYVFKVQEKRARLMRRSS